ncbi:hypothetical protein IFM89_004618 [Coptis chinensis]|uniref:Ribosome production factor 2 homolog n=1 Tax=Coptis chinensis TaxID=261450 RepID=A0A835LH44_9MAGN|nr:hypothetical protein IFM89_004618 [Coptis chinensis]
MLEIKTPKNAKAKRELDRRAPKLVENGKKTLILAAKTSYMLNSVLTEIFHLKRGSAIKYSRKNDNIRPFENGGETSLEFFSQKTDCSLFVFGSHSKKRPDNLVLGRTYDHHIYDLVEVGVENFRSMNSYSYDKKIAPKVGTKPFFAFIGEGFESVEELKHLKEVLLDLFRGEDGLVEVGPSMDLVMRRHRLPNDGLRKEGMKTSLEKPKKKVGGMELSYNAKGLKRERREAKMNKETTSNEPKKQKVDQE